MTKKEKMLLRLRQNPKNVRFDDIVTILLARGFKKRQDGSSHVIFKLGKYIIDVPHRKPFVKEVYVKLLLRLLDEIEEMDNLSENEEVQK
jgi:predicted RNA binding protein YcfA (HicA-like mRNA interferase family)